MALIPQPILVNGAEHSAQTFRLLVKDLSRGAEGITEGPDLKVTQLGTPGAAVQVASGTGVIRGRVNVFQGSYSFANLAATSVDIAATGGSPRSDLLIVRIEDPDYEGTLDPAVDPIVYFQVIPNVSPSATTIPDGRTGIPLARIDIPANTATITDAYIKDVRKIANARRDRNLYPQSPTSISNEVGGTTPTYTNLTTAPGWPIPVPTWASTAKIKIDTGQIRYSSGNFTGVMRATFGSSLTVQNILLDDNQGGGIRRATVTMADNLTIPDAYRGTTQTLRVQVGGAPGNAGLVSVDSATTLIADVEFFEAPR
ncbi:hypothetical protein [Streptomyces sp. NPDC006551]|uniref:hypothetical protein n=1 Tax=Streptomyces sp. NPDC006551 TaxID=3157178 RepID=UPI0033B86F2B